MPTHSINSSTNWTLSYYFEALEEKDSHNLYPFRFDLIPESLEVGATKPAKMKFKMDIWLEDQEENNVGEDKDPVWTMIARSAEEVAGTVTVDGSSSIWYCKKLRVEDRLREGSWVKCFTLETRSPLEIRKQGREMFNLVLNITFQLGGSLQDQITRLMHSAFPEPTPRPGSSYDDSVSLVSHPPNLALQISLTEPDRVRHVWVQEERLAAASEYLAKLVKVVPEPEVAVFATRSFDYRLEFDAVDDDSDSEEDTRRYNLCKERGKLGDEDDDRRSEAPEPAEDKSDGDEASQTSSLTFQSSDTLTFLRCYSHQQKGRRQILTEEARTKEARTKEARTKEARTKEARTKIPTRIKRSLKLLLRRLGPQSWILELLWRVFR